MRSPHLLFLLPLCACGGATQIHFDAAPSPIADLSQPPADAATAGATDSSTATKSDLATEPDLATTTAAAPDPNLAGPYTVATIDDTFKVAATGDSENIHCVYPTGGPSAGPYPIVFVAHGFELPITEYANYVQRLASFGYIALTPDFPASLLGVNNVAEANDLLGSLDWVKGRAELSAKADFTHVGASGHSLGGKVALLAATMAPTRIQASITLDPVDSSMNCSAQDCPAVKTLVGALTIPTGFVGETTDAMAAGMACAPASDNYTTYYANTKSPSIEVTAIGADHMSFLDDVSTCGLVCDFCNPATAPNAQVNQMAIALVTAFYERYLRGDTRYDSYLTGALAQTRYVQTGEAQITSR